MDKIERLSKECIAWFFVSILLFISAPSLAQGDPDADIRSFDRFAGMCLLPDDPAHIAGAGGYVRPYILSKWFLYDVQDVEYDTLLAHPERLEFAFDPSYADNSNWINDGLRSFHEAGLEVVPSFKESFMFLTENDKSALQNKPRLLSEDGNDPWSWRWIGIYFYQFAAHYGSTQVPDSMLLLRNDQQRISGLGWVNYVQGENEADKWWLGEDAQFTPEEWAAYHSVMYDGHMGQVGDSLGLGCGVKAADPNMKVVLGPLAHLDYEYLNRAIAWWEANRTDPNYPVYPFDVMSFHRYANTAGRQRELNGKGQSPEAFGFYDYAKEFADFCHEKGKEAWITEFGYDTHPASTQGITPFGGLSTEEIQGMWLTRSYLTFAAAGMDRAAMYMLRDVAINDSSIFSTSGFTSVHGSWEKKPSWYYFNTMVRALEGFHFKDTIHSGNPDISIYKFQKDDKIVYAYWCPTSENKQINNYGLNVPSGNLTLITPQDGNDEGNKTYLQWNGGMLNVSVSELPRFLLIEPQAMSTGEWENFGPYSGEQIPGDRHEHSFIEVNGKFYMIGGRWDQKVEIYDPMTNSWSEGTEAPISMHHFQAVAWNGKIYVLGAFTGNFPNETPIDKIYIYDPTNDSWSQGSNIPRKRGSAGAFTFQNKIYLVGGIQNGHESGHVAWLDEYDPATNNWATLPDAPRARDHFQAAIIGDQLILASGRRSSYSAGGLNSDMVHEVDIYNFVTGIWSTASDSIPTIRAGAAAAVIDDEVLIIGGESEAHHEAHQQTEAFNVLTQSWRSIAALNQERHATQAINFNGNIYIASGSKTAGDNEIEGHETFFMERLQFGASIDAAFVTNTTSGDAPLTVNFDGSNSLSAIGPITTYSWNFGDGNTATGVQVTHEYTQPGIYTASLSIFNANGDFDVASQQIEVIDPNRQDVLFITKETTLNAGDSTVKAHLEELGYFVIVKTQDNSSAADANDKVLVVISSSVSSGAVNTKFTSVTVPVISFEPYLYDDLGMAAFVTDVDFGVEGTQTEISIVNDTHPLAGGQTGVTQVYTNASTLGWGILHEQALKIATVSGQPDKAVLFGYEKDMAMISDLALARRIGFFMIDTEVAQLTTEGWQLFDSAVCWAVNCNDIPAGHLPPNLVDVPSQTHTQGDTVFIQLSATDPEGQTLTYSARKLIDGLAVDAENGIIQGVITAEPGNYYVKVLATDNGTPPLSDMKGFSWIIHEAEPIPNQAPILSAIPDQMNQTGDTVALILSATDPENDTLKFSAINLPEGLSIDTATGEISGIITAAPDTLEVTITVTDDGEPSMEAQQSFNWIIFEVIPNQTPNLSPIADQNSYQGDTISLVLTATDPENDILTFSALNLPAGLEIDSLTGEISGFITASPGTFQVTATVKDDGAPQLSDSQTFSWIITVLNEAPILTEIPNQSHQQGNTASLPLLATDPNGDPITYAATNLPEGLALNPVTGLINGTITAQPAIYEVEITVSDNGTPNLSTSQIFNWEITAPLTEIWLEAECADYGAVWTLANDNDASNDQFLTTTKNFVGGNSIEAKHHIIFNAFTYTAGTYQAWMRVESGGGYNSMWQQVDGDWEKIDVNNFGTWAWAELINVDLVAGDNEIILAKREGVDFDKIVLSIDPGFDPVNIGEIGINCAPPPNQAPQLAEISDQQHPQESEVSLALTATDPDGNNLIFSASGLPASLTIHPSTGLISGTLNDIQGAYPVTITVTDDGDPNLSDSQSFVWAVSAPIVNEAPVLAFIENQNNQQTNNISLELSATDPNLDDVLTFEALGLPDGLSINASSGLISGIITADTTTYQVTITVNDDGNPILSDVQIFDWTVTEAPENQAPVLNPIANQENNEGETVSLQLVASDPDGHNLTFSQIGLPLGLNLDPNSGLISGILSASPAIYDVTISVTDDGIPNSSTSQNFTWTIHEVIVPQTEIWLEAECASFGSDWDTTNEGSASEDAYLTTQSGFVNTNNIAEAHLISFEVFLAEANTYAVWLRIKSGGGYNSMWQDVNGSWKKIDVNNYNNWTWVEVESLNLNTGNQSVVFAKREGFDIDKIVLSSQAGFSPSGVGEIATNCSPQPNQAPQLSAISDKEHEEGETVSFFVQATDPEGDQITYSATGLPSDITLHPQTGNISGTLQVSSGVFNVVITATDNGDPILSDTESFVWTVTEILPNQAPNLTTIPNQTHEEGTNVSIFAEATDPEGDNITYSAMGIPPGLSINGVTGEISGIITATPNTYSVNVTATDNGSPQMSDTKSFTWTIIEAPIPSQTEMWLEAECVDFGADWYTENAGDASQNEYITTEKGFVGNNNIAAQHIVSIEVNAVEAGNYSFWMRIKSGGGFNSIWQLVDGDWEKIDVKNDQNWFWKQLEDMNLNAGINTLQLAKREGVSMDKFVISSDGGFSPTGTGEDADNCGSSRMGRNTATVSFTMDLYPNPANNEVFVRLQSANQSNIELRVIDMMGKVQYQQTLEMNSRERDHRIDLSGFARGVYHLESKQGNFVERKSLVVK